MDKEFAIDGNPLLQAAVESANHGERVVLTRNGKPVANVTAPPAARRLTPAEASAHLERVKAMRRGMTLGSDLRVKDLINEERR